MRLKWNRILVIPLIIAVIGLWLLWPHSSPKAGWFDDNWMYRAAISLGNTGSADSNKKVKLDIDTAALITANKIQSDCGDSRFTDATGKLLKYYIDSAGGACNTSSTDYYVLMESIPVGGSIIYHYYGNTTAANGTEAAQFSQATFTPNSGPAAASEEQSAGPVLSWSMNEVNGTTLNDNTLNANTGTLGTTTSAPTWTAADLCVEGSCLKFDGTNDYVSKTYSSDTELNPGTTSFSVSAWFRHTSIQAGTDVLISRVDGANANGIGYKIYMDSSGFICFGIDQTAGSFPVDSACSTTSYADSKWHQVTGVKNGTTSIILYIDGQQIAADTSITSTTISGSSPAFRIGIDNGAVNPWDGFIDVVKVYPYARSADQVKTDFTSRGSVKGVGTQMGNSDMNKNLSTGLVGYWKLDENTGNTILDLSGNQGTSSTFTGNVAWTTGKYGAGLTFDGTDDVVRIPESTATDLGATTDSYTLSVWFKTSFDYTSKGDGAIVYKNTNGSIWPFRMTMRSTNKISFTLGATSAFPEVLSSGTYNDNFWHQAVGVRDVGSDKIFLYIDGVLIGSTTDTTTGSITNNDNISIGNGATLYTTSDFKGDIDEVRIYNRALEYREVAALYNQAPGPVAYWDFDEGSGQFASDESGNSLSGTLGSSSGDANQDPTWVTGKFGNALDFNQTNTQYVDFGNQSLLYFPDSFTLSMWVKRTGTPSSIWGGYLLSDYSHICTAASFAVRIDQANTVSFFWENPGGTTREATSTTVLPLNAWSYVTAVYDGTTRKIYVNGVLEGTNNTAQTRSDNGTTTTIGRPGGCADLYAPATIDEVKIYNYARTSSQIFEDMNGGHPIGGSPVGSQVGYWKFDEGYGTTAYDMSSNANNLTLTTASWTTNGKFGGAWNGTNANWLSQGGDDNQFDFAATEDISISGWFKSDSVNNPGGNEYVVSKSDAVTKGYAIYFNSSGQVCFGIDDDNTWTPTVESCSSTDYYDNTWHYIVAIRDTNADKLKLYVDKKQVDSDTDTTTGTLANSTYLIFGDRDAVNNGDEFTGDIDEVKIYRAVLTDEQIKLDYNQGQSTVMGAASTASDGITADNSSARAFCVPGDTSTCSPPVGWWSFDENQGTAVTSVHDLSGNNIVSGTFDNPLWISGKFGSAVGTLNNGVRTYVSASNAATGGNLNFSNAQDYTTSIWLKASNLSGTIFPFRKGGSGSGDDGWAINVSSATGLAQCFYTDGNASGSDSATSISRVDDGKWHLISCDMDRNGTATGTAGLHIFIDGKLEASDTSLTEGSAAGDTSTLDMGEVAASTREFDGGIDEARVFNYARTRAQIAWDYNQGGPVAWYKMDECTGTTIHDWALNGNGMANGNDGTLTVGATGSNTSAGTCTGATTEAWKNGANGKINSSLSFDGTDDYVNITTAVSKIASGNASVSFWFKPGATHTSATTTSRYIFSLADASSTNDFIVYLGNNLESVPGAMIFALYNGSSFSAAYSTQTTWTAGTWYQITAVYSSSAGMSLYVDGKLQDTDSNLLRGSTAAAQADLGRSYDNANFFYGSLDDVRMYNYALTPLQVKTIMNNGSSVNFAPITGSP